MTESPKPPGATIPRRRRSAEVARKEILDAAQRLLSQGGPDAIRLQEIARDVGIAHPTILHHFGSREGLIQALDARAIRALSDDVAEMLQSERAKDSGIELVERLAHTMDDQGLARLIAWWAMREPDARTPEGIDPPALVRNISRLICDQLANDRAREPEGEEAVSFGVRLAVVALFGDALIGDILSPVQAGERDAERHRFHEWLADLLIERITDPTQNEP